MSDELDRAVKIATVVLDRVNADPDDDLAVLSRQLLRAHEHITHMQRVSTQQVLDYRSIQRKFDEVVAILIAAKVLPRTVMDHVVHPLVRERDRLIEDLRAKLKEGR